MMTPPTRFCFGLHLHQPVGNFDSVFADHLSAVYGPLLDGLERGAAWPVALHVSGPLLDWLETHATPWLDRVARLVADGQLELLAAGYDEPILIALEPADRIEQIARHRERLLSRFGVDVRGLWLTERVWEPDLPITLAAAGIAFVLVDDHHLDVTGLPPSARYRPWTTEAAGSRVSVLAIDQQLRYLVPFRPVDELADYLQDLHRAGEPLAVLADDGEKFGGWPGTADWVWQRGWFDDFTARLGQLIDAGTIILSRFDDAIDAVQSQGPIYLPSASYPEMERWALPAPRARELARRQAAAAEPSRDPLLRGGHWRHFLVKYPESNRLHKVAQLLSAHSRERGDPAPVRRHIGRAQCNDAYWHGVFGGLYLPFLRAALWRELAHAAELLFADQPPGGTLRDVDCDGSDEVLITSPRALYLIAPQRGGALEVALDLRRHCNLADAMTRYEEAYHTTDDTRENAPDVVAASDGADSIHDAERNAISPVAIDDVPRALLVDRFLSDDVGRDDFVGGTPTAVVSHAHRALAVQLASVPHGMAVQMSAAGFHKTIVCHANGSLDIHWRWQNIPDGAAWFSTELSLAEMPRLLADGAERWEYPIETVARSEAGFDRTHQGTAVVLRWPAARHMASLRIAPLD